MQEEVQQNLLELELISFHCRWHLVSVVKAQIYAFFLQVVLSHFDNSLNAPFDVNRIFLLLELVLRYVVYLLEVLDPVQHLRDLVVGLLSNGLSVEVYVRVQFLNALTGELSVALDLLHQGVSEEEHLVFSLHDLFQVDNVGDLSDDKQFVFATSDVNVDLVKRYELCCRGLLLVISAHDGLEFEGCALFVFDEELPHVCNCYLPVFFGL